MEQHKLTVALVGFGYWGTNLARNFFLEPQCQLSAIVDADSKRRQVAQEAYPSVPIFATFEQALASSSFDVVAVATPVATHFALAKQALLSGAHVFVTKPLAMTSLDAQELVTLAHQKNRTLMVDHTYLFTGAVEKLRTILDEGVMGELLYYDSVRVNLGLLQQDVNVLWDLAAHDFAILLYLRQKMPRTLSAQAFCRVHPHLEDVGFITAEFDDGCVAHFHLNWLSPVKIRRTLIGGRKQMLVWDDLDPEHKIKVYDKGVDLSPSTATRQLQAFYRVGSMNSPVVFTHEPLSREIKYFLNQIRRTGTSESFTSDGSFGLQVVQLLESASRSVQQGGRFVSVLKGEEKVNV